MNNIADVLKDNQIKRKKQPKSEKAFWQQTCADFLHVPFMVIFGKTKDVPKEWIHQWYDDAKGARTRLSQEKRLWQLIRDSKILNTARDSAGQSKI